MLAVDGNTPPAAVPFEHQGRKPVHGKDRTSIARGLDPAVEEGKLVLVLIRCHRGPFLYDAC